MSAWLKQSLAVPDLEVPWRDLEYCVVDVETTGLDLRRDELVSFGSILIRSGRLCLDTGVALDIKPSRPMSVEAMTVHGKRQQDHDDAPPVEAVAESMVSQLDGRVLVAHAAWIELAFLRQPVRVMGRRWKPAVVDTAALLRATGVAPSGTGYEPDLESSAGSLGLPVHTPHEALGDALTTGVLFLALAGRLEQTDPRLSARSLVELSTAHTLT